MFTYELQPTTGMTVVKPSWMMQPLSNIQSGDITSPRSTKWSGPRFTPKTASVSKSNDTTIIRQSLMLFCEKMKHRDRDSRL